RRTLAELVEGDLATLRRDPYLLSALCPVADLCARVGDAATARTLYGAIAPHEEFHGNVSFGAATYGPTSLHLARLATRMGDLERAEEHARRGLAAAERMPSPTYVAVGCLAYAGALVRSRG